MKVKSDYIMREVAGNHVVVPTGKATVDFNGMITLNETGAFLWKQLSSDKTEEELLFSLMNEYDVDEASAKVDISKFLEKLRMAGLLD
jgi:hypothetical protein